MSKEKNRESWQDPLSGGIADNRAYRQFVASSSKTNDDNLAVAFGQLNEVRAETGSQTKEDVAKLQRYKMEEASRKGPVGLRVVRTLMFVVACLTAIFLFMLRDAEGDIIPVIQAVCVIAAVMWLVLLALPRFVKKK